MNIETGSLNGLADAATRGHGKRRRFQFTLVRMFVIVAMVALVAATLGRFALWAISEREFRQALKDHQAGIDRDEKILRFQSSATDASLAIVDRMDGAHVVDLSYTQITDKGLALLIELEFVTRLWLQQTRITDAGMKHLANVKHIRQLALSGTKITDAGVAELREAHELEVLALTNTNITDEALKHLAGLKSLAYLHVENTNVKGDGFKYLAACPSLKLIWVDKSQLSPEAIESLRQVKYLDGVVIVDELSEKEMEKYRAALDPIAFGRL